MEPSRTQERMFYKISEVSSMTGLEAYVLRYWETEFPFLRPQKSRGGQRTYQRKDIETILKIKRMLYDQGYTIAGARRALAPRNAQTAKGYSGSKPPEDFVYRLRGELNEILRIIDSNEKQI